MFDSDGAFRAVVELPGAFRPDEISGDRLLGRTSDELDVEYVVAYGLEVVP